MKDYSVMEGMKANQRDVLNTAFDKGYLQGVEDSKAEANRIAENAYKDGYEAAKEEIAKKQSMSVRKVMDADYSVYKQGMDDAWELCRKIERMLFNKPQFQEAFGEVDFYTVITNMSVSDAMEKVKAWEEKQKSGKTDKQESTKINVSDVVHFSDNGETMKAVVLDVDDVSKTAVIFDENGCVKWIEYKALEKTGEAHLGVWNMLDSLQECVE